MPSYISYTNKLYTMDADDDNIESWITVNGNHIPIMKGQSKEEAVKNFIAKKSDKESSVRANKPEHISKAAKQAVSQTKKNQETYKEAMGAPNKSEELFASKYLKRAMNTTGKEKWDKMPYMEKAEAIKKHKQIEAAWQKTLKSLEPQTAEQARLWLADTLASTEGFTSANFSKEDKETLKRIEAKFGDELAKMEEENALYEQAWRNVEEQERINNEAPGAAGVFYTDFLSPSEMYEYENKKEQKVKAEFERLKGEKEKSEKKDGDTTSGEHNDTDPRPKNADPETVNDVLFEKYVPAEGKADTLLGEQLRAINRIVYRYENDGDMYGNGYGVETVNAPVKFLQSLYREKSIPGLSGILSSLKSAAEYGDTTEYEYNIQRLKDIMVKTSWETLEKLANTKNTEDMYSFRDDTRYDADDEEW